MLRGGKKKVRVIEYPQIVWGGGGPHTNQMQTLIKIGDIRSIIKKNGLVGSKVRQPMGQGPQKLL